MKIIRLSLTGLLFSILISCGGGMNEDAGGMETSVENMEEFEPTEDLSEEAPLQIDRKLIKTAYLTYEVEDIHTTEKDLKEKVRDFNGYITNESQYETKGQLNYNLEIKVPNSKFDGLMTEIAEGVKEFDQRSVDVQDVTEEFIDIEARLKTKKEIEQKFIDLLDMATSIGEVLQIESELKLIREEIESIEGRLKYLKSSVSYSTIHVTFYEEIPVSQHYGEKFSDGVTDGWKFFVYFLVMLVYLWPFFLVSGVIIVLVRYRKKKRAALK